MTFQVCWMLAVACQSAWNAGMFREGFTNISPHFTDCAQPGSVHTNSWWDDKLRQFIESVSVGFPWHCIVRTIISDPGWRLHSFIINTQTSLFQEKKQNPIRLVLARKGNVRWMLALSEEEFQEYPDRVLESSDKASFHLTSREGFLQVSRLFVTESEWIISKHFEEWIVDCMKRISFSFNENHWMLYRWCQAKPFNVWLLLMTFLDQFLVAILLLVRHGSCLHSWVWCPLHISKSLRK